MNVSALVNKGFRWEGKTPVPTTSRQKAIGWMYSAHGILVRLSTQLHMGMWYHGALHKPTLDEGMTIKGIEFEGNFYDAYWHAFMTDREIWVHHGGWFADKAREKDIWDAIGPQVNYNWQRSQPVASATLKYLGFKQVV